EKEIPAAHSARNSEAKMRMQEAITLFEWLLLESADGEFTSLETGDVFEVMPINGMERLHFIKGKPGQYACYRQLDELFKETKKRAASLRLRAERQK
ncbi:MAG: hypothetical protein RR651_12960, partial [Lysinibacillus sp.]